MEVSNNVVSHRPPNVHNARTNPREVGLSVTGFSGGGGQFPVTDDRVSQVIDWRRYFDISTMYFAIISVTKSLMGAAAF
jgi:hypothetical protein